MTANSARVGQLCAKFCMRRSQNSDIPSLDHYTNMPPKNNNLTRIITEKLNNIHASPLNAQNSAITPQRVKNDSMWFGVKNDNDIFNT